MKTNLQFPNARWIFLQFCIFALLPTFAQTAAPDFTDPRDSETYKTVIMPDGKRWMAENLRYRKGLDNPVFSNVPASSANTFAASKNLYYCPGPGPLNASNYPASNQADPLACEYWGALYPYWVAYANAANTAVNTTLGEQGICPPGWHLPTDREWNMLFDSIGGSANAGKLLKDTVRGIFANNQAWTKQWTNAALQNDNTYGFSAIAAGLRTSAGAYSGNGTQALFWTSTPNTNGTQAYSKIFTNNSNSSTGTSVQNRADALSVRCIEGKCRESSKIIMTPKYPNTCDIYSFDTIEFSKPNKTRIYDFVLTPSLPLGSWSYTISYEGLPSNGVNFVTNPTTSASQIIIELQGLSALANEQSFRIKIEGTNPNYCKIDTQIFEFRLLYKQTRTITPSTHVEFTTTTGELTDGRDGKKYPTIKMGDGKWWMAKNLEVGECNCYTWDQSVDSWWGASFDQNSNWSINGENMRGKCRPNPGYGYLYNWIGTTQFPNGCGYNQNCPSSYWNKQVQGICPDGWHVPGIEEFQSIPNAWNVSTWTNPDTWNGLHGGNCNEAGILSGIGTHGVYWSKTFYSYLNQYLLYYTGVSSVDPTSISRIYSGSSVRCVMN